MHVWLILILTLSRLVLLQTQTGQLHAAGASSSSGASAPLSLEPGRWLRFYARLSPRALGRLRAERATLLLSDHAALSVRLSSFPPGHLTLGNLHLHMRSGAVPGAGRLAEVVASPFRRCPEVVPGMLSLTVQHLGPLPAVAFRPPQGGNMFVGELLHVGARAQPPFDAANLD